MHTRLKGNKEHTQNAHTTNKRQDTYLSCVQTIVHDKVEAGAVHLPQLSADRST